MALSQNKSYEVPKDAHTEGGALWYTHATTDILGFRVHGMENEGKRGLSPGPSVTQALRKTLQSPHPGQVVQNRMKWED